MVEVRRPPCQPSQGIQLRVIILLYPTDEKGDNPEQRVPLAIKGNDLLQFQALKDGDRFFFTHKPAQQGGGHGRSLGDEDRKKGGGGKRGGGEDGPVRHGPSSPIGQFLMDLHYAQHCLILLLHLIRISFEYLAYSSSFHGGIAAATMAMAAAAEGLNSLFRFLLLPPSSFLLLHRVVFGLVAIQ